MTKTTRTNHLSGTEGETYGTQDRDRDVKQRSERYIIRKRSVLLWYSRNSFHFTLIRIRKDREKERGKKRKTKNEYKFECNEYPVCIFAVFMFMNLAIPLCRTIYTSCCYVPFHTFLIHYFWTPSSSTRK